MAIVDPHFKCLVIDDDRDFADEAGVLLRRAKIDTEVHYLGVSAISSMFVDLGPTIIIADLGLPAINGWGIVHLAADLRSRNCPVAVVIVSANAEVDSFRQAIQAGVHDYLVKPVDPKTLVAAVRKAAASLETLIESRDRADRAERRAGRAMFLSDWLRRYEAVDRVFPEACHSDGHLRMMLYICTESARGVHVSVSSACYASGLPFSTALRRLQDLIDVGLVEKRSDMQDGRRQILVVTAEGDQVLDTVWRMDGSGRRDGKQDLAGLSGGGR